MHVLLFANGAFNHGAMVQRCLEAGRGSPLSFAPMAARCTHARWVCARIRSLAIWTR